LNGRCGPQQKGTPNDSGSSSAALGYAAAGGFALALLCGVGKIVVDWKRPERRRKQPWEID
jgi:hypothetical protein